MIEQAQLDPAFLDDPSIAGIRSALEGAHALAKAHIQFLVVPLLSIEDATAVQQEASRRFDLIADYMEAEA